MASSSSAPRVSKYDVFLSFRGEDTRKTIVSHLYAALESRGIVTFKDDQRLEIGDHISDELRRALDGSSFAVVVLSENYATSRWCLLELQLIMELMKEGRLEVFPIFYGVDPSVVRHQLGSFALEKYQGRPQMADKVLRWREALNLVANLSGVDSRNCVDEAIMVGEIARDISRRVTLMHKIDSGNIVGKKAHMEGLSHLLDLESDEVLMVGVWGMGGIGKTSIVKCLYDQLSSKFPAHSFTENIKSSVSKDNGHDLKHLQKELLCSILCDDIRLWSVEAGCQEIKKRLGNQRVFLVLDGVDKVAQVHALAKEKNWFGPGSRIIITTRDMGLLNTCGVEIVYEVKCLDDKDSLEMFKKIAFEGGSPPSDGFDKLSIRASRLAHGLPSAIQAHALFLRGRKATPEEWEESLGALESSLDENIMEILKISYEGLPKPHQNVFLHMVCLFNGDTLQRITSLLHGPIPQSSLWIRVLAEKSLIKISTNGCVIMHKLVEQMGIEIIHDDMSLARKFLRDPIEIRDALAFRDGGEQTECLSLHTCEMTCVFSMEASVVGRMHNLKFLKVYKHVDYIESKLQLIPEQPFLPRSLRLFHWDAFPLRALPSGSDPCFLVELNLRYSDLETLWSGTPMLKSLKRLDVTGSKYLKQLPDLSSITSLEELILEHCTRLEGIPECIGKRSSLKKLKLSYCGGRLRSALRFFIRKSTRQQHIGLEFPDAKVKMDSLINITIGGDISFEFCSKFKGFAEYVSFNSEQQIPVISTMSLQQAPWVISECNRFNSLSIMRFSHKENGESFSFDSFPDFPDLKELTLVNLNIRKIPFGICYLEFLEKLDLSGNDFENLPEAMNSLSRLKTLWLRNCCRLKELPELHQVQSLTLTNCRNLRSLVKLFDTSHLGRFCLLELSLENCNSVKPLSDQLKHFTRLTYLDLSSHDFERLPSSIRDLTSLVTLCLNNCKKLISLEELPLSLQFLDANGCDSLEADSVEYSKELPNKKVQPRNDCFQDSEMPSYVLKNQATRSGRNIRLPKITPSLMFVGIPLCMTLVAVLVILLLRVFN